MILGTGGLRAMVIEKELGTIDELLIEKLESALHKPTQGVALRDVAKIALEHSAVDLAIAASRLPPHARAVLFKNFSSIEEQIKFLINTDAATRLAVFREVDDAEIAGVIAQMPPDEAVEVLEALPERRYRKVLEALDPQKALRIQEIEKNARNTAGRLMTNEFFAFSIEARIGDASETIRNHPGVDLTRRIFVLNANGELQGYVPARTLIVNSSDVPLREVMRPILHKAAPEDPREEIVDLVDRYKISALPVVDGDNRLLGVITYEDVLDALEDILDETIGSVAGTSEKVSENHSSLRRFVSRSPWLLVTLCSGLLNVVVMSAFDRFQMGILTFVFFFVPLITGMSGNIGIQSSTVLVRSMALGYVRPGNRRQAVFKELRMGLLAASFFGLLCAALVYAMDFAGPSSPAEGPWAISLIVSVGLFGACLAGSLLGVFSPLLFSRLGVDPAVASGPIVTALNDFLSMSIYFLIAVGISSLIL